jgi:hypothetical protein
MQSMRDIVEMENIFYAEESQRSESPEIQDSSYTQGSHLLDAQAAESASG